MADELLPAVQDPTRPFVAERIQHDGWGAIHAINWAFDRDVVATFRDCVMLVRLCQDPIARQEKHHNMFHRAAGLIGHAGLDLIQTTQRSLGISDERARYLIDQMDAEHRAYEGLRGSGGA